MERPSLNPFRPRRDFFQRGNGTACMLAHSSRSFPRCCRSAWSSMKQPRCTSWRRASAVSQRCDRILSPRFGGNGTRWARSRISIANILSQPPRDRRAEEVGQRQGQALPYLNEHSVARVERIEIGDAAAAQKQVLVAQARRFETPAALVGETPRARLAAAEIELA